MSVTILPNGDLYVVAELEIVDKGDSSIHQFIYSSLSWTQSVILPNDSSTDYEAPAVWVDGSKVKLLVSSVDTATGLSYQENVIKEYVSSDNAMTWTAGVSVMSQTSHVEYSAPLKIGDSWYMTDNRGYTGQDPICRTGFNKLGSRGTQSNTLESNGWSVSEGFVIIGNDSEGQYCELIDESATRGFMHRQIIATAPTIRIEGFEAKGDTIPDIRVLFGCQPGSESEDHYLWILQDGTQSLYSRVSGVYTLIPAGSGTESLALDTKYDVRVEFNGATNAKSLFLNDVLIASEGVDSTWTSGGVGISCATNVSPELVQPVRMRTFQVDGEFYDDFISYPTFVELEVGQICFAKNLFRVGRDLYITVENRDTDTLNLYRAESDIVTPPTVEEIADQVWDEDMTQHISVDSAGEKQNIIEGISLDVTDIKTTTDQFVFTVANQVDSNAITSGSTPTVQQIVNGVWDETSNFHTDAGTFGVYLDSTLSLIRTVVDNNNTAIISGFGDIAINGVILTPAQEGVLASSASITALNDFNPATDIVAHVTLVDTTTDLTNQNGGG